MKFYNLSFFLSILIETILGFITYDTGFASQFHYEDGFLGYPNTNYLKEFSFSGTFEKPPQVAFVIYKYNYDYYQPNGYDIEVTEITTTKFKVLLRCLYQHRVWDTPFNWYAYDDRRIQVISIVNYDISQSSASFSIQIPHPHFNPNFSKGIIHVTSLCYTGPIDFELSIVSINLQDVVIQIKSNNFNLIKLGYQIFLSIDDAIDVENQIVHTGDLYTSPTLTFPSDKDWTIGLQGLNWGQTINLRVKRIQYSNYYTYGKWVGGGNNVSKLRFTSIYFHRSITQTFLPWIIRTVRVSQTEYYALQPAPIFTVVITELNKVYATPATETLYVQQKTQLHVQIRYQCDYLRKKLYTEYFMCSSCNIKKLYYYCLRSVNAISIYALLNSQTTAVSVFTISVTNNGITIIQIIQNQQEQIQQILKVEIQNN
ncbi:unnamed protein product (macronuclear) [Paramecium tetraurelia]|uniref:H-type lectin domain-containing protein n=1 Tax=Paramecium tetraurelia TaxID=5888 RepID=A0DVF1_PARTE|nr:uncharacterized protein GSPATT00020682001 [Paramecium tetraurelia]CAK87018.1 unnamed protein product [Paramecium tetraurelia]|eukprot:XP_001454415.1 hypothetical protein (macronuclear) [Paramecium tetraurelia strain d4-2]